MRLSLALGLFYQIAYSLIFQFESAVGQVNIQQNTFFAGGTAANSPTLDAAISGDGRFLVFESYATNLGDAGSGLVRDIYLQDRQTHQITRLSKSIDGGFANKSSLDPFISRNGRYIVFSSQASNLVPGDTNGFEDVFLYDRDTGSLTRESLGTGGIQGNARSYHGSISDDGRFFVFATLASNFFLNDTTAANSWDVFLRDRTTNVSTMITQTPAGFRGSGGGNYLPSISGDGSTVVFHTFSYNIFTNGLTAPPNPGTSQIAIYNRGDRSLVPILDNFNRFGSGVSYDSSVSYDGNVVAFASNANGLVDYSYSSILHVYVWTRASNSLQLLSKINGQAASSGPNITPVVSGDGNKIVFQSSSSSLNPQGGEFAAPMLATRTVSGPLAGSYETTYLPISISGGAVDGEVFPVAITHTGEEVVLLSSASNIVAGDDNGIDDIVVSTTRADLCPLNQDKTEPGICGCTASDSDTDNDGILNCLDQCPTNAAKNEPLLCGCGIPDVDSDNNGMVDCWGYIGAPYQTPPPASFKIKKKKKILEAWLPFYLNPAKNLKFTLRNISTNKQVQKKPVNGIARFENVSPGKYYLTYSFKRPDNYGPVYSMGYVEIK
jgi:Tol biopolymer transport system component